MEKLFHSWEFTRRRKKASSWRDEGIVEFTISKTRVINSIKFLHVLTIPLINIDWENNLSIHSSNSREFFISINAKYIQIYRQPLSYPSIEFSFKVTQFQKLYVRSIGRFLWKVAPRDRQRTLLVPRKGGTVTGCETNRANYLARGQQRSAELSTTDYRFSRTFIPRRSAANGRPADTSAGTPGQIRFRFNFLYEYRFCAKRRVAGSIHLLISKTLELTAHSTMILCFVELELKVSFSFLFFNSNYT